MAGQRSAAHAGARESDCRSRSYHNKLGTQLERIERFRVLASRIQTMLPRGTLGMAYADRAALLAKADLRFGRYSCADLHVEIMRGYPFQHCRLPLSHDIRFDFPQHNLTIPIGSARR